MKKKITKTKVVIVLMILLLVICIVIPPRNYNSKFKLTIIGPYGDNQSYHPKVLNFKEKWNGYKYWMSYTPYPQGDDLKENPCIAVSNDLIHWKTPDGLVNPLDVPAGKEKGTIYNSDAHLVYNNDTNTLEIYWRYTNNVEGIGNIYRRTSKDGINWTTKELAYHCPDRDKADNISPAIIYENKKYKMWYVENKGIVKYTESDDGINWEESKDIDIKYESKLLTWHLDVIKTQKGYEMIVVAFTSWEKRNDMSLYYSYSADGLKWDKAKIILKPSTRGKSLVWDNKGIYRSSFIYEDGIYYVYYGGTDLKYNHGIGLVIGKDIFNLKQNDIYWEKSDALEKFNKMVENEKK